MTLLYNYTAMESDGFGELFEQRFDCFFFGFLLTQCHRRMLRVMSPVDVHTQLDVFIYNYLIFKV